MIAPFCNSFVRLDLGLSSFLGAGHTLLMLQRTSLVDIALSQPVTLYKGYTYVIIQNMYFMFDV